MAHSLCRLQAQILHSSAPPAISYINSVTKIGRNFLTIGAILMPFKRFNVPNLCIIVYVLTGSTIVLKRIGKKNRLCVCQVVTVYCVFQLPAHNCFGPPSLLVEGILSTGPTPSSFHRLFTSCFTSCLPLHFFPASIWCELDQLFIIIYQP